MTRHYGNTFTKDARGIVQADNFSRTNGRPSLPESILRLAHAEYAAQGHSQSFERIQERGGFGMLEVYCLLADYVERLGGQPTEPRRNGGD